MIRLVVLLRVSCCLTGDYLPAEFIALVGERVRGDERNIEWFGCGSIVISKKLFFGDLLN